MYIITISIGAALRGQCYRTSRKTRPQGSYLKPVKIRVFAGAFATFPCVPFDLLRYISQGFLVPCCIILHPVTCLIVT